MRKRQFVIHTVHEIEGIRRAAGLAADVREELRRYIRPGITSLDVDRLAGRLIADAGAESAFYGYRGFPAQICISINDEVVHGIGSAARFIQYGDLVSIDCGVRLGGCIGDTAATVSVGPPSGTAAALMRATQDGLAAGIDAAAGGRSVGDIGAAVEAVVKGAGFGVVRDYVGHGCGTQLHEPPEVPNYAAAKTHVKLVPGMVLAIEPMVNAGSHRVKVDPDGWTVRTHDGEWSAHFEHMILITESKPEILTWHKTA